MKRDIQSTIAIINEHLDNFAYPLAEIAEVDDDNKWDELGSYLGGAILAQLLREGIPQDAKWFVYDEDEEKIIWYKKESDILDAFSDMLREIEEEETIPVSEEQF